MNVRILFFGALSEAVSAEPQSLELDEGATTAGLRQAVAERWPASAAALETCMIAVNQEYVASDHVLAAQDEVAFLPPVSGG